MRIGHVENLAPRRNKALDNNPPTGAQAHISTHGSDFLWMVFAVFLFVDLCLFGWCVMRRPGTRLLNQIAILILTISAWDYFGMASNLGWTTTPTSFNHYTPRGTLRQVWWSKYVDWILTAPLLLILITFVSGTHWRDTMAVAFAGALIWTGWLLGALIGPSQYKWAYWVFGIVMGMWFLWYELFGPVRLSAAKLGSPYKNVSLYSSIWYAFLMLMYAIAWGCCEGGNTVSNTSEVVWYGILDLFAKPFFLIVFLWFTRDTDYLLLRQSRYHHEHPDGHVNGHHEGHHVSGGGAYAYNDHTNRTADRHSAATTNRASHPVDAEKAAHASKFKLFGRKGAHDDTTIPPARSTAPVTVPPVQTAAEYGPTRVSNATMVESDPAAAAAAEHAAATRRA